MNFKPPNILVFTGSNTSKLFKNVEDNILRCVQSQNYLVYHLLPSEIAQQPWMESTSLLVISSEEIDNSTAMVFENYIRSSGRVLLICSKFSNLAGSKCLAQTVNAQHLIQVCYKDNGETPIYSGKYSYFLPDGVVLCQDSNNRPVIQKSVFNGGILIASEIYLDRDPGFIASDMFSCTYNKDKQLSILKNILVDELGLKVQSEECPSAHLSPGYFVSDNENKKECLNEGFVFCECLIKFEETYTKLPIYYSNKNNANSLSFDTHLYFSNLNTETYGHSLVYFPAISSTMDVAEQLSNCEGIVIAADCQLSGKGRGTNKWISPKGCAMFTLHLTLPLFTNLGKKLSLIQHMAALAVVHGIRNQLQYKNLNIKIKWPNDIYFDEYKIGGLIVASTIQDKLCDLNIGWGINVTNSDPTICLNDAVKIYNKTNSCSLPNLCIEEVIASTISQMEYFIKDFQTSGPDKFFSHYYSYWLHDHQKVKLENLNERGIIMGLDEYGFLLVKTEKGQEISLQPDGNRFDIIKNLIYSRK